LRENEKETVASQSSHQLLRHTTRKRTVKILIKIKAKGVKRSKGLVKNRNYNDFFLRSQLLYSCDGLWGARLTLEVRIALGVTFVISLPPLLQRNGREACQLKDCQG